MAESGQKLLKPHTHAYLLTSITLPGGREIPALKCRICEDTIERRDVVARYKKEGV